MNEFDEIYLGWQRGLGAPRYVVGMLKRSIDGKYTFEYDRQEVEKAKSESGFIPYIEFSDTGKIYNGNVLDIFAQRLINPKRTDVQKFYDFWEIAPQYVKDKFFLLGHTQAYLPTDNFEFLANYNPVNGLHFLTDLDILSGLKLTSEVAEGDYLNVKLEVSNKENQDAVAVYKGNLKIGYIKKVHCRIFHKSGAENLKLKVKAIDKNGVIKRIFVKVYKDQD